MSKPKVGDLVRLKTMLVHKAVNEGSLSYFTVLREDGYEFAVYQDFIEEILMRPLQVGDKVNIPDCAPHDRPGRILAIDADRAWVKWSDGSRGEWPMATLRRIDDA